VAASSDLDSTNHHESTVVMVSFNIDKVQIWDDSQADFTFVALHNGISNKEITGRL
jgi:hypothetical protein